MTIKMSPPGGQPITSSDSDASSTESITTSGPVWEGVGSAPMFSPKIQRSQCLYVAIVVPPDHRNVVIDEERKCSFQFVAEARYQRHLAEHHGLAYGQLKRYLYKHEEEYHDGLIPRHRPESGPGVVDRKVRESVERRKETLKALFS